MVSPPVYSLSDINRFAYRPDLSPTSSDSKWTETGHFNLEAVKYELMQMPSVGFEVAKRRSIDLESDPFQPIVKPSSKYDSMQTTSNVFSKVE